MQLAEIKSRKTDYAFDPGRLITIPAAGWIKVFDLNPHRWVAIIVNTHAQNNVRLRFGDTVAAFTVGPMLTANGGSITFGEGTDLPVTTPVYVSGLQGSTVEVMEMNGPAKYENQKRI